MPGLFISFEGVEGCGKTTQIKKLYNYLASSFDVLVIREPGGTQIGEDIRNIILDTKNIKMCYMTEAMLYAAARCQLTNEIIIPALNAGRIIICDRFLDSSLVYQGYARGLGLDKIKIINEFAIGNLLPDITFYLDLPPCVGLARKKSNVDLKIFDRIENESIAFHNNVYKGFDFIARLFPNRIHRIDASEQVDIIHKSIIEIIDEEMKTHGCKSAGY